MLLQLIVHQPQVVGSILQATPAWVSGTLAALLALGYSQTRDRRMSRGRVAIMPLAMTGLSAWGMVSAFGSSPQFAQVLLAWFAAFAALLAVVAPGKAHARYDAASRSFEAPGSWLPMLLILAIFLTKYVVGVELAMQPQLSRDGQYTLVVGTLYGAFSGIFAGRAARLWRLVLRPQAAALPAATA